MGAVTCEGRKKRGKKKKWSVELKNLHHSLADGVR